MSLHLTPGYPLAWPAGRPRTRAPARARFGDPRAASGRLSLDRAKKRLLAQLEAMTRTGLAYRTTEIILSTNIRYTASGTRDQNVSRKDPDDVGVALYFNLDDRPYVLACDRWDSIADNIAAIAAHIDALRGQERWGVADLAQAFAGHMALPSQAESAPEQWWQVLGVSRTASIAEIEAAWRKLAPAAHPDTGGSDAAMSRIKAARDAGRKAAQP
jgi:hypothetical protein